MAKTDLPRIAILGAGPIGMEAALYARALKYPFKVFESGRIGEHVQRWGHVRLFSPFGMNSTSLGRATIQGAKPNHTFPEDDACITGREHVSVYLAPLAESLQPNIQLETQVLQVGRRGLLKADDPGEPARGKNPFRLLVRDKKGERHEEADVVLDCTGIYAHHRWLGDGGIPALGEMAAEANIAYGLEDVLGDRKAFYANKNVLVVGGGYSAATTVCNLAQLGNDAPSTWVIWLARCDGSQPLKRIAGDPLKERDRLTTRANNFATRNDGNVEFHAQTVIDAVEFLGPDKGFKVVTRCAGKPRTWEVDRIIANVGYTPDRSLYRELQIHECYVSLGPQKLSAALQGQKNLDLLKFSNPGPDCLKNPEPDFFILGAKSFGRNTNFFLRVGFEQVRDVFSMIAGNPKLNLYKQ